MHRLLPLLLLCLCCSKAKSAPPCVGDTAAACLAPGTFEMPAAPKPAVADGPRLTRAVSSIDCSTGPDSTLVVQAAVAARSCLPPGTYMVDVTLVAGRVPHGGYMFSGWLCGSGSDRTSVVFRGDAGSQFFVGLGLPSHARVRDVRLDTSCLTNCGRAADGVTVDCTKQFEQTHLTRVDVADDVQMADVVLVSAVGGDCVNVVGPAPVDGVTYVPNHGLSIDNATFEYCKRGGVQVSRGEDTVSVTNSRFGDTGFDFGTEGAGFIKSGSITRTLTHVIIAHNQFTASRSGGLVLELEWADGVSIHHNMGDKRPLMTFMSDNVALVLNHFTNTVVNMPVLNVGDEGHAIGSTNDVLTQMVPSEVIRASPLDKNRPAGGADLRSISITSSTLVQAADADFVVLSGVTGYSSTDSTLVYAGPPSRTPVSTVSMTSGGVSPAVAVPTTGVVVSNEAHVGFP